MKKILLSLMLIGAFTIGNAQLILNEIYPDPSIPPNEEYIELFNTGNTTVSTQCYTLVTYSPGSPSTLWVYALPTYEVTAFGFVVFASDKPIDHQGGSYNGSNAFSWNVGGALTKYTISGTTLSSATFTPPVTDLIPITGGNSTTLNIMLFDENGELVSGFFANNSHTIPTEVINLGDQNIGACGTLHFGGVATNSEIFDLNQAPGNDNGYRRKNNGFCGTWEKAEPANTYSPGESNGTGVADETVVQLAAVPRCYTNLEGNNEPGATTWEVTITVSQQNLLPAYYTIYEDANESGAEIPDAGDVVVASGTIFNTGLVTVPPFMTSAWRDIYIQVTTNSNCIQKLVQLSSGCAPLPVKLKSFNAARRNTTTVELKWETAQEENSKGFYVERKLSNGGWQSIAFVESKAIRGNSSLPLSYEFTDLNDAKGISQYRLRQVDIDSKQAYSQIRAVRGEGQKAKTIIYPNPSGDGKVNIVFENVNSTRDVSLMDISGKTLKQWRGVTNNNIQIDNLNAGFYSVRIVNNETGEQTVEKFIVNKR